MPTAIINQLVDGAREGDVVDVAHAVVVELLEEQVKLVRGGLEAQPRQALPQVQASYAAVSK